MKKTLLLKTMLLLCALVAGSGSVWADDTYTQVTDVDDLETEATYIIADVTGTPSTARAMGVLNSSSRGTILSSGLSVSGSSIVVSTADPLEFTLTKSGDYYTISYGSTATYLGYNSGTAFVTATSLPTGDDLKKYQWNIEYNDTYKCLLINNVNTTARYIIRNGTSAISAYASSNLASYGKSTLYKKEVSSDPSSDAAFANTTPAITYPAIKTFTQAATTASSYTGTVVYEITANTAGATLEGTTVTVTKAGTVTVQATAPAITGFSASTASYTLTVTDSRSEAGLAYADASQDVHIGEVLSAPALTNPNSLVVTYESSDESVAMVDGSGNVTGVSKGTATITASFAGNDVYLPGSASYTIKVTRAVALGELFYESVSGYTSTSDGTGELSTTSTNLDYDSWNSFSKVYAGANGHLKFGSSSAVGKAITKSIALRGSGILTYKVMRFNADNAGELKVSVTGAKATGDVDVTGTAAWVEKTLYLAEATGNVVITFESTADGKRIRVDDISLVQTHVAAPISTAEYATFSSAYALDFSATGITVYTATDNETSVTLNEVATGKVPANTPVVLYKAGADGTAINVPVIASADAIAGTNDLRVSTGTDVENMYVLAMNPTIGFYPWEGTNLSAGKVYLQGKASYSAREFIGFDFGFGGETTGVNDVRGKTADVRGDFFDLQGRKVANPTKGLYIVNGKKVAIR